MSKEQQSGGIGFLGLLTIVFIVLKLCNVIDWSWWWVLAPTWIPTGIILLMSLVLFGLKKYSVWRIKKEIKKTVKKE